MGKIVMELFVHEKDVTTIYKKLQELLPAYRWDKISIGYCGWVNAPDCWWVRFPVKNSVRRELIEWIDTQGFDIYNPELIY